MGGKTETECKLSQRPEFAQCNRLEERAERENCYVNVAFSKSSAPLCDEICSDNLYNLCIVRIAKDVKNPNLCQKIRQDDWRYTECVSSSTTT